MNAGRKAVLAAAAIVLVVLIPEFVYRTAKSIRPGDFQLGTPYGIHDPRFGVAYRPGSSLSLAVVQGSGDIACMGIVFRANEDGLTGNTTLREFRLARTRLLITGDSVSHWRQRERTIPDLVEANLRQEFGRDVRIINFARGGYGLMQMVEIASAKAAELRPDLVVVQFISDDLTRGRWWLREAVIDGRLRIQAAADPQFRRIRSDTMAVDSGANAEWCERARAVRTGADRAIAESASDFVRRYRVTHDIFDPWSVRRLYFHEKALNAIAIAVLGHPVVVTAPNPFSRVGAEAFTADPGLRASFNALSGTGIPVFFVHLPMKHELEAGRPVLDNESSRIWAFIEASTGRKIATFFGPADNAVHRPPSVDLMPLDPHPSDDGMRFYANIIARLIDREL